LVVLKGAVRLGRLDALVAGVAIGHDHHHGARVFGVAGTKPGDAIFIEVIMLALDRVRCGKVGENACRSPSFARNVLPVRVRRRRTRGKLLRTSAARAPFRELSRGS
jgi:hypothetical protein